MFKLLQMSKIQSYEPISYFDGLIIFDDSHRILYGNESAIQLVDLLGFDRRLVGSSIYSSTLKNFRYTTSVG